MHVIKIKVSSRTSVCVESPRDNTGLSQSVTPGDSGEAPGLRYRAFKFRKADLWVAITGCCLCSGFTPLSPWHTTFALYLLLA